MLLTVFCLRRDRSELTFSLQVDADFELQNFRALCELESGIPAAESRIVYAERPLTDNHRSLASYGLKDGDVVILQQVENAEMRPPAQLPGLPRIDFSSITVPGTSAQPLQQPPEQPALHSRPSPPELPSSPQGLDNPALLRDMLLANPHELSLLKERNPPLAEALLSGDLERFTRVLVEQQQDRARREQERIRLFSADPFDLEAQAKIEEDIRQQNIEENMTIAMEEAPESFGQVVMLYINCKVNGHPVKAFVDSGAQMTIMSQACAERCNIMRLVDRRWAGIAKGVGTQKIIGRVHLAQVQIEGDFLPCSFSILEEQPMDMLLGLDMLKRHQCSIDLKKNVLVIGTTGSQTTFLPEGELPECARLAYGAGREDARPEEIADQELAEAIQKSVEEAENSDKETTSLETPPLPTSDGLQHPVHFPEAGPKTSRPASRLLDRSFSAPSGCHCQGRWAETVCPRAARSVESLHGGRERPPLLPPLNRSGCAASARVDASPAEKVGARLSPSPALPPQSTFEKRAPCSCLERSNAEDNVCSLQPPAEIAGRGCSSDACAQTGDPDVTLSPELLDPNQMGALPLGLEVHEESGMEQPLVERSELTSRGHLLATSVSPPLAGREQPSCDSSSEGGQATEGETELPSWEGRRPGSVPHEHPGGETFMAVDAAEEALPAAGNQLEKRDARLSGASAECSAMEVDSSKCESFPARGLMQPGSTTFGSTGVATTASLPTTSSSEGQLSNVVEEPGLSLTSALKELHQLLVESCKGDLSVSGDEGGCRPATVPGEQTVNDGGSEEVRVCPELDSQGRELCFPGSADVEASSAMPLFEARAESVVRQEVRRVAVTSEQDLVIVPEPSDLNSSVFQSPSAASDQLQRSERSEAFPPWGQNQSLLSDLAQNEDASWSPCRSEPEAPDSPSMDVRRPPDGPAELPPPGRSPVVDPAVSLHPGFPATDIDRIVRAGFTPQEAGAALESARGSVDLAILILLAKNIVVPT